MDCRVASRRLRYGMAPRNDGREAKTMGLYITRTFT